MYVNSIKMFSSTVKKWMALTLFFAALLSVAKAQNIDANTPWIWMGGDTTLSQPGLYGTKGVPSIYNKPGARSQAASWTDNKGNFWLFGGRVYGSTVTEAIRNDLWRYKPSTKEWTWISGDSTASNNGGAVIGTIGVPSINNTPSVRSLASYWMDNSGMFWVYGGNKDVASGFKGNDLWQFNPITNEWALISGNPSTSDTTGVYGTMGVASAANHPGARTIGACWTDNNGDLWMFGGQGQASTSTLVLGLSDWWKYNISSNQWTWMGGPNISSPAANFGTQGLAAPANIPGGRYLPVAWKDTAGIFWMMGGVGYVTTTQGYLNDLWKFDPTVNQWTWVQGSNTINNAGRYISQGVASTDRMPRSRCYSTTWVDLSGNLWLFGGVTGVFLTGAMNDIWKFDVSLNQWSWIKGDSVTSIQPVYNAEGIPNTANEVGSRGVQISWREKSNNNVWVFGGHIPAYSTRNDLWKIQACNPIGALQAIAGPDTVCPGDTVIYTIPSPTGAISYMWNTPAGWTGVPNNGQIALVPGSTGGVLSIRVLGSCGDTSDVQIKNIVVATITTPVISQSQQGNVVTLSSSGTFASYQWYLNGIIIPGADSATFQPLQNGNYTVKVTSVWGCTAVSAQENISGITGINDLKAAAGISIFPNPANMELNIRCYTKVIFRLTDIQGKVLIENNLNAGIHKIDITDLIPGIYFSEFRTAQGQYIYTQKIEKIK